MLEIGYMVGAVMESRKTGRQRQLQVVKEFSLIWQHQRIRENFKAFYFLSFICEMSQKTAPEKNFEDDFSSEVEEGDGLFSAASNALYHMERSLEQKRFELFDHLFFFLSKISLHLGVALDLSRCQHCFCELENLAQLYFRPEEGGFSCTNCCDINSLHEARSSMTLRNLTKRVYESPYRNWDSVKGVEKGSCEAIFRFLCYQFQWRPEQFISFQLLL